MTIRLPWPPRELSPNARCDRRAIAGIRRRYRETCGWTVTASGIGKLGQSPLHVDLTFCAPDKRPRDLDNMLASAKAALDGLSDAIGCDDRHWSLTIRRGDPVPGGAIWVRLGPQVDAVPVPFRGAIG
jgi:crossover junction endodeoxyribonuclease RusA